ncbi:MAG: hypothetical protein LBQ58_06380 [Synergistaceae bacterium]|nr:hypothetical protein [Synergistaceae bacterium]
MSFSQSGNDGVFTYFDTEETITVENWFYDTPYQLTEIKFLDGTVLTADDVDDLN